MRGPWLGEFRPKIREGGNSSGGENGVEDERGGGGGQENVANGKIAGGKKAAEMRGRGFDGESWQVENRRGGGGFPYDGEEREQG